tara:strand:- start:539 stop:787 length:249 start_codon:yes stop_codon:yes gene_type:complete
MKIVEVSHDLHEEDFKRINKDRPIKVCNVSDKYTAIEMLDEAADDIRNAFPGFVLDVSTYYGDELQMEELAMRTNLMINGGS